MQSQSEFVPKTYGATSTQRGVYYTSARDDMGGRYDSWSFVTVNYAV
jgi:hypothetical protein